MKWDAFGITQILAALMAGGGLTALFGWKKPMAEADKIKAEAEELVWGHMKETIQRLQSDVEELKQGRLERDKEISILTAANAECVAREKALVRRIKRLEQQIGQITT